MQIGPIRRNRHPRSRSPRRLATWALAIACLAAMPLLAGCGGDDDKYVIGSVFSFSEAGESYGQQQLRGAELAVDIINADGGIDGKELELVQADVDTDNAADLETATRGLIDDGAIAILGPTFSNNAADVHPIANELQTPVVAVSNTAEGIVGNCDYPCDYVFRVSLGEAAAIPANVGSLAGDGTEAAPAVVVYPENDAFGQSTGQIAAHALTVAGHEAPAEITVTGDPSTWSDQLGAELDDDTTVVFITASAASAAADLIKAARGNGFEGQILGGNAFNGATASELAGADGSGARSASAWRPDNPQPSTRNFFASYNATYAEAPDQFAAQAYTAVLLLAEALRAAEDNGDSVEATRSALAAALPGASADSPLGSVSFTPEHDISQPTWLLEMDGNGSHRLVGEAPTG